MVSNSIQHGVTAAVVAAIVGTAALIVLAAILGLTMVSLAVWHTWVAAVGWQAAAQFTTTVTSATIFVALLALIYGYAARKQRVDGGTTTT